VCWGVFEGARLPERFSSATPREEQISRKQARQTEQGIDRIKKALLEIGAMRPGSLARRYNVLSGSFSPALCPKPTKSNGPYDEQQPGDGWRDRLKGSSKSVDGRPGGLLENVHPVAIDR
jgi:hypothetical protein